MSNGTCSGVVGRCGHDKFCSRQPVSSVLVHDRAYLYIKKYSRADTSRYSQ